MNKITALIEAHFQAIIERRVEDIIATYADSPETYVFVEGPRWSTRSFERIAYGWRGFTNAPLRIESIAWTEGPFMQAGVDMAWLGGIVLLGVRVGGELREVRFRGTFVLRQADGAWYVVHEHFSQPAADPYGIGDWLPRT